MRASICIQILSLISHTTLLNHSRECYSGTSALEETDTTPGRYGETASVLILVRLLPRAQRPFSSIPLPHHYNQQHLFTRTMAQSNSNGKI